MKIFSQIFKKINFELWVENWGNPMSNELFLWATTLLLHGSISTYRTVRKLMPIFSGAAHLVFALDFVKVKNELEFYSKILHSQPKNHKKNTMSNDIIRINKDTYYRYKSYLTCLEPITFESSFCMYEIKMSSIFSWKISKNRAWKCRFFRKTQCQKNFFRERQRSICTGTFLLIVRKLMLIFGGGAHPVFALYFVKVKDELKFYLKKNKPERATKL